MSNNDMVGMDPILDPFDPQTAIAVEAHDAEQAEVTADAIAAYVRRRQAAYKAVFGDLDNADVVFVLQDLATYARAFGTAFDPIHAVHALKEGRREMFYRIVDSTRLSHDTLYTMLYEKVVAATAAKGK